MKNKTIEFGKSKAIVIRVLMDASLTGATDGSNKSDQIVKRPLCETIIY